MDTGKIRIVGKINIPNNNESSGDTQNATGTARRIRITQGGERCAPETETNAGTDAGTETGTEAGTEAGNEAGTEAGTESDASGDVINPEDVQPLKRRGRPRGSKNKTPKSQQVKVDGDYLLMMLHVGVAALLKMPELAEIDSDDTKLLRERYAEMADAFGWKPMFMDARLLASINMMTAIGAIYGPRVSRARKRIKETKTTRGGPVAITGR